MSGYPFRFASFKKTYTFPLQLDRLAQDGAREESTVRKSPYLPCRHARRALHNRSAGSRRGGGVNLPPVLPGFTCRQSGLSLTCDDVGGSLSGFDLSLSSDPGPDAVPRRDDVPTVTEMTGEVALHDLCNLCNQDSRSSVHRFLECSADRICLQAHVVSERTASRFLQF